MRILWVATKPSTPPRDGGRLVSCATLDALVSLGIDVVEVAPSRPDRDDADHVAWARHLAPARAVHPAVTFLEAMRRGEPLGIARHRHPAVADAVARALDAPRRFDVVHVEQLQALVHTAAARAHNVPRVMRAQNVESDAWANAREGVEAWMRRRDASRLRRYEAAALRDVAATVTLSATDALRFRAMAPGATVVHVPPPAPASAPAVSGTLPGHPACAWIGSGGWPMNADALAWLTRDVWPAIVARCAGAQLHVFGTSTRVQPSITAHVAPDDIAVAFDRASILLLPLRHAGGVRMRILDAWARGVPVVASPAAADGLDVRQGDDLLLADGPAEFADAVERLAVSSALRDRIVEGGRDTLRRLHDPATVAARLVAVYRDAIAHARPRR